ncbi:MAG: SPOR domain-containing protein [Sulfurimonas sp.]|nr:SPOR domain-containing protein [Sulfurimonas sp.]MBU3938128.1 SPOR domain-containing protein [bacterium]MBU4025736.1 SPOR domain-containing protein [bacterium]MBU4058237.1 SPOR domain-containing protein [bacterium]MBU4110222.1 SPOR domain-containing protein [bacterium]
MQEKNELNDIILNKNNSGNGNKKIVLAVATLGIILIIVVMLMNSITSSGTDNLPQAVLPPEPTAVTSNETAQEPLFEEVPVVQESAQENDNLDNITQKLKQESQEEKSSPAPQAQAEEPEPVMTEKAEPVKAPVVSKKETTRVKTSTGGSHYIQVGSFSKYAPNKTFLKSITDKGYKYEFREVKVNSQTVNKVLVGPFSDENEARDALKVIRKSVESGAFITKI